MKRSIIFRGALLILALLFSCQEPIEDKVQEGGKVLFDNNDESDTDFVVGSKWSKNEIRYYIEAYSTSFSKTETDQGLEKSFKSWADVTDLTFKRVFNLEDADIVFSFGPNKHSTKVINGYCPKRFDVIAIPNSGALAHAFYPGTGALAGDVHFGDYHHWSLYGDYENTLISFVSIATHEIGHSLGVLHSEDPESIMFATYDSHHIKYRLSLDDIKGIQSLYGSSNSKLTASTILPFETEVNKTVSQTIQLKVTGTKPVTITSVIVDLPFSTDLPLPSTLQPDGLINVKINYSPTSQGTQFRQAIFVYGSESLSIDLQGTAKTKSAGPSIALSGNGSFGEVSVNSSKSATFNISNNSDAHLIVSSVTTPFGFSCNWNGVIPPGNTASVSVTFTPLTAQQFSGNLQVNSNSVSGVNTIFISGNGKSNQPVEPTQPIVSPTIGTYGNCVPMGSKDCNFYNRGYMTSRVVTIDRTKKEITFELKKCSGTQFNNPGTLYVSSEICGGILYGFGNFSGGSSSIRINLVDNNMIGTKTYHVYIQQNNDQIGYNAPPITISY